MNALRDYLQPASKKSKNASKKADNEEKSTDSAPIELLDTPSLGSPTSQTPAGSRFSSRPSSIYPAGDFRNATRQSILDIKSDVMVNWLHQQQLERLWGMENGREGIVLKKSKGDFTCSPPALRSNLFFNQVVAMNVRVSFSRDIIPYSCAYFISTVCHDSQYAFHQDILEAKHGRSRSIGRWPSITSTPVH